MATLFNARLGLSVGATPINIVDTNGNITSNTLSSTSYISTGSGVTVYNSTSLTTSTTTANQVFHTASTSTWRMVKYFLQITSGSAYQGTEITLLHDGTNVYKTEYGQVYSGSSLATFDADINTGNIRLLVTPVNAATTIKGAITQVST